MRKALVERLWEHSIRVPEKIAVIADNGTITYKELWGAVLTYASKLRKEGIGQGDVVILKAMHTLNFVIAEHAVHLVGAVTALIEKDMQALGIKSVAEILDAKLVIADEKIDTVNCWDIANIEKKNEQSEQFEAEFPEITQCAEIIYTTGTTGQSKGVQLSHNAVVAVIEDIAEADRLQEDNVALVPMPLNHVFGLRRYQTNLYVGATVVLQECLKPVKKFFKALNEYHVTSLSLVPSAISYIFAISKGLLGNYAEQIRFVESSAAPISMENKNKLRELLPKSRLLSFYGCTESTSACVIEYSKDIDRDRCAGKPTCNTEVAVIDEKITLPVQEPNIIGRVIFKSDANMMGYWKNPEVSKEVLVDGYVYTNDEGYFDEEGYLYLLGRKDDVINVGGNKVAPEEVEDLIMQMEQIEDCGCIGIPNEVTGNELVLCIKTQSSREEIVYEIRQYLSRHLENYKIPTRIELLDEMPRTYNGKLQRNKLRERFQEK